MVAAVLHATRLPQSADAWPKWLRRFDRPEPKLEQISRLLYAMGDSTDDMLQTLRVDEKMSPTRRLQNH